MLLWLQTRIDHKKTRSYSRGPVVAKGHICFEVLLTEVRSTSRVSSLRVPVQVSNYKYKYLVQVQTQILAENIRFVLDLYLYLIKILQIVLFEREPYLSFNPTYLLICDFFRSQLQVHDSDVKKLFNIIYATTQFYIPMFYRANSIEKSPRLDKEILDKMEKKEKLIRN